MSNSVTEGLACDDVSNISMSVDVFVDMEKFCPARRSKVCQEFSENKYYYNGAVEVKTGPVTSG